MDFFAWIHFINIIFYSSFNIRDEIKTMMTNVHWSWRIQIVAVFKKSTFYVGSFVPFIFKNGRPSCFILWSWNLKSWIIVNWLCYVKKNLHSHIAFSWHLRCNFCSIWKCAFQLTTSARFIADLTLFEMNFTNFDFLDSWA